MREIKFRAWFTLKNKMVLPEDLQLSYDGEDKFDFAFDKSTEDSNGEIDGTMNFELLQYTGLKDKNGKEIYEGDIVDTVYDGETFIRIVVYDESELGFKATNGEENYGGNFQYLPCCEEVEVIGNIYENPELINS